MKKLFKPASLLFNFLCLLVFFIVGMYFAGWIEAGKNQGLAGGAVVLGWGVLFAGIAFVISFILTYNLKHKRIVEGNWVLLVLLLLGFIITYYRFTQRDRSQEKTNNPVNQTPATPPKTKEPEAMLIQRVAPAVKSSASQCKIAPTRIRL